MPGLSRPPSGVVLEFEAERGNEESPPRPRAFWREEWLRGSGGNGGVGKDCSILELPSRGHRMVIAGDDSPPNAAGESARARRVFTTRRGCCFCRRDGPSSRDKCRCRGHNSSCKGLRPGRCCSNNSLFRDSRVGTACCGGNSSDPDARAGSPSSISRCRGLSGGRAAEQSLQEGERGGEQRTSRTSRTSSCGKDKSSGSSEGVSVVVFVVLAAVAVAAFAVGTLLGPPRRQPLQHPPPPPPPSSSPSEYAPLRPSHQVYEQNLPGSLHAKRRGAGQMDDAGYAKRAPLAAAGGDGESRANASAEPGGRRQAVGVGAIRAAATGASARGGHSRAVSPSHGEEEALPEGVPVTAEADVNGCERGCGKPSVSSRLIGASGIRNTPSISCCTSREAAATVGEGLGKEHTSFVSVGVESGSGSAPATPVVVPSPGGVVNSAGSSGVEAGSSEADPSRRSSSSPPSPGAGAAARAEAASERRRLRRQMRGHAATAGKSRTANGATPAAFALTLGLAERSLAGFSTNGEDEKAERVTARRAEMSKSAARSACKSLAWGKAAIVAGADPHEDDGVCDTDAVWKDMMEGLGSSALSSAKNDSPRGGYDQAADQAAVCGGEAAGCAMPGSSALGLDAADDPQAGHGAECSFHGYAELVGLSSSTVTAMTEAKTLRRQGSAGGAPRDSDSRANGGQGHSSPPLAPRCRALVLSGNDVQASWAGRYVPVKAVDAAGDARRLPEAQASSIQHTQSQTSYYYCRVPSLSSGSSKSEEDPAPPALLPPSLRDVVGKDKRPRESAVANRPKTVVAAAGGKSLAPPTPTETISGKEDGAPLMATPDTSGTAAAATVASSRPVLPPASTTGTAASPGNDLGLPDVTDGGALCLYWADVGGEGRWVLDDDLRLANGVLGVTKSPAPAAADLAFPNRRHHPRAPPVVPEGIDSAATSSREARKVDGIAVCGGAGQGNGCRQYGGLSAVEDGRLLEAASRVEEGGEGAAVGRSEADGEAGRAPLACREGQPTWLLDSPRRQDWVEANLFLVCEKRI